MQLSCRMASAEEVRQVTEPAEEPGRDPSLVDQDARFFGMMEDLH